MKEPKLHRLPKGFRPMLPNERLFKGCLCTAKINDIPLLRHNGICLTGFLRGSEWTTESCLGKKAKEKEEFICIAPRTPEVGEKYMQQAPKFPEDWTY